MIVGPSFAAAPPQDGTTAKAPLDCSVIVPFFNEEQSAASFLTDLRKCLAGLSLLYEALLVDDGSTDGTAASLQAFAASWPECTVVRLPQNQGQAAALLAGFSRARGEIIVTLDGDGQNDPADIPLLLDALAQADMVAGVRSERRDSWLRRGMSRLANAVRRWLLKDGVVDTGCALKAFVGRCSARSSPSPRCTHSCRPWLRRRVFACFRCLSDIGRAWRAPRNMDSG
jgi:dolichol-phosphate mannosyltransferase